MQQQVETPCPVRKVLAICIGQYQVMQHCMGISDTVQEQASCGNIG